MSEEFDPKKYEEELRQKAIIEKKLKKEKDTKAGQEVLLGCFAVIVIIAVVIFLATTVADYFENDPPAKATKTTQQTKKATAKEKARQTKTAYPNDVKKWKITIDHGNWTYRELPARAIYFTAKNGFFSLTATDEDLAQFRSGESYTSTGQEYPRQFEFDGTWQGKNFMMHNRYKSFVTLEIRRLDRQKKIFKFRLKARLFPGEQTPKTQVNISSITDTIKGKQFSKLFE